MTDSDEEYLQRKLPLAHVRLFRKEILESGVIDMDYIEKHCSFLGEEFLLKLRPVYETKPGLALSFFYRQLVMNHPEESAMFYGILIEAFKEETALQNELHMKFVEDAAKKRYLKLFPSDRYCTADIVSSILKAGPFINNLKEKYEPIYREMIKKVENLLAKNYHDAAACQILREMPRFSTGYEDDSWWLHFLDICDSHPGNRAVLKLVDDDFRNTIDKFREDQKITSDPTVLNLFDISVKDGDRKFRSQMDFIEHREKIPYDLVEDPAVLELRDYQEELLSKVKGTNAIICAPTGSGKTVIAAQLIFNHFEKKQNEAEREQAEMEIAMLRDKETATENEVSKDEAITKAEENGKDADGSDEHADSGSLKSFDDKDEEYNKLFACKDEFPEEEFQLMPSVPARVVMFVPTIPLVEQQSMALSKYMRKKYYVHAASGAQRADSPGKKILCADIVVITPQMFYNFLIDPRESERLYISDFTMFIFDECHHCNADHPYKNVMKLVRMFGGEKPHIVGLTASLGVGFDSRDIRDARNHMITMCANLSAESISTVRHHIDSLRKHVAIPDERIITVARTDSEIRAKLVEIVKRFEEHVVKRLEQTEIMGRHERVRTFPDVSKIAAYIGFLSELRNRVTIDQRIVEKNAFLDTIKRVKLFYEMLNLVDLLPARLIIDSYCRMRAQIKNADKLNEEQELCIKELLCLLTNEELLERDLNKHILRELKGILEKEYSLDKNTRTLIFVTTRNLASHLCEHLNKQWNQCSLPKHDRTYQPVAFITSTNKSGAFGGVNAQEQASALDNFRCGHHRVLVATSVADEGLDIASCNLIIKYNSSGNELTKIQRRGRGRAKNSKSYLLALDGAIEKQELESARAESLMHRTLDDLNNLPSGQIKKWVAMKQEELRKQEKEEEEKEKSRKTRWESNVYVVACMKCSAFITKSTNLRVTTRGSSEVAACDGEVWNRLSLVANEKVFMQGMVQRIEVSRVLCATPECGNHIAALLRDGNTFMPFLKASAVSLYTEEEFANPMREGKKPLNNWRKVVNIESVSRRDKFSYMPIYVRKTDNSDRMRMCTAFEKLDSKKTAEVRVREDRKFQGNVKLRIERYNKRQQMRSMLKKNQSDPNAEDDDYGYSANANDLLELADFPLRLQSEETGGNQLGEDLVDYEDSDDEGVQYAESGDEGFAEYT
ncbi:hypothetical protein QR680_010038 [Steinernema hermaphroditum]|uniref:RNA helicase n=1 Tax=Steinernema hermaphroditum TaxID=289476 RepID=A0AA39IPY1_9BILA|nr:hypothetical protein QR680_010038 [Steinernema hermaphroditum]